MHKKLQRSVAIQSNIIATEISSRNGRLCKKAGFRNLLHNSVTVVPQDNDERSETLPLPGESKSRSVQAALDGAQAIQNIRFRDGGGRSLDFSLPQKYSPGRDDYSRRTTMETPGTSSTTSAMYGSVSAASLINETYLRPQEGSLAVVYSYGERISEHSRPSNLAYFYETQGSRRFSDETVILIEDYQSYDYTNAARRQDMDFYGRGSIISCCNKNKRGSMEVLTRPLPINVEDIQEKDEGNVCRICHEGEDVEPLIQPCLCKGSVGSVHAHCLKVWLEQSNTSRCELCGYPYAIRQTKKYPKCLSVKVFFGTVVDRRSLAYDVISFVIITPLTLVGVAMCIQASIFSSSGEPSSSSNFQMGNITKAGMVMLSGTIIIAYGVWLYTLISYHFKSWKKWYSNCYDVEVIPVRMTSEERLEAARRLSEEINRRQMSREQGSALLTVLHSPNPTSYSFYQTRVSAVSRTLESDR